MGNGWSVVGDTNLDQVTKYFRVKINEEQRSKCLPVFDSSRLSAVAPQADFS